MDKLTQWRDGLLSDAEILGYLMNDMASIYEAIQEVQSAMLNHETHEAERKLTQTA